VPVLSAAMAALWALRRAYRDVGVVICLLPGRKADERGLPGYADPRSRMTRNRNIANI